MPTGTVIFPTSFPSWLPQFTTLPPAPALKWSPVGVWGPVNDQRVLHLKVPANRSMIFGISHPIFTSFWLFWPPLSSLKENHKGEMKRGDQNGHLCSHSSRREGGGESGTVHGKSLTFQHCSPFSPSYAFQSWSPVASKMKQTNYLPCVDEICRTGWSSSEKWIRCLCLWFLSAHLLGPCCFLLICFPAVSRLWA